MLELVLALGVFGVAVVGVVSWLDVERAQGLARESGRTVAVLAHAARHHVQAHYAHLVGGAPRNLSRATLAAEGILPENFIFGDAMKRDLAVLVLPDADGVRVLSGQVPAAGDDRWPQAAVTQGLEGQRLGMVETTRCPDPAWSHCLIGPGVSERLDSATPTDPSFVRDFPNQVRESAIMALYEFDHDDWCGDFVHRVPASAAICAGGNRMSQPVRVTGRLVNAASIENVTRLEVHGAVTVGGELNVGGTLESEGRMTVGAGVRLLTGVATVDGRYRSGARNPACSNPSVLSAVCNEDRVLVGDRLTVAGTASVLGPTAVIDGDTDAGHLRAGCIEVSDTATVEGRVRVTDDYGTPAGSCP